MRLFGYPYNDLVICKDSPDYLGFQYNFLYKMRVKYGIHNNYFNFHLNTLSIIVDVIWLLVYNKSEVK